MKNNALVFLCIAMLLPNAKSEVAATDTQAMKEARAAMASSDYAKAFARYSWAAQNENNPLAQFSLGLLYQNGWGRAIDNFTACQWFEKAAQSGIPAGQHLTGVCIEEGVHGPANPTAAAAWYLKAAQSGHHHSYCHLGNLYMHGTGVPRNPAKALQLCYRATQLGAVPAQVWMGKFYLEGDPSIQDDNKAYRWFEAAAQKNVPEAIYYLGMIINKGMIEGHSPQHARQRFEQAAKLKYIPAYFQTGKSFYYAVPDQTTKQLTAENLAKAYVWLSAAIQQSENPDELTESNKIMEQILTVMPKTWRTELDQKVTQHLKENHQ